VHKKKREAKMISSSISCHKRQTSIVIRSEKVIHLFVCDVVFVIAVTVDKKFIH
jgi:hypothetical protein